MAEKCLNNLHPFGRVKHVYYWTLKDAKIHNFSAEDPAYG